jgi:hypothetical protein
MNRQMLDGAMPWRRLLGAQPPWVHWSLWIVWWITASLGPIVFVVGLLVGSDKWWIGLAIYAVALIAIGIDWLIVRRLRRRSDGWAPWNPPRWLHSR